MGDPLAAGSTPVADRYLARRLMYRSSLESGDRRLLDPVTGGEAIRAAVGMVLPAVLVAGLVGAIGAAMAALSFVQGGSSGYGRGYTGSYGIGYGNSLADGLNGSLAVLGLGGVIAVVLGLVVLIVLGRRRQRDAVSRWELSFEGGHDQEMSLRETIVATLQDRGFPAEITVSEMSGGLGRGRPLVVVTMGPTEIVISVVAYGSDLHVSWSMWRSRSRFRIIGAFLRQVLATLVMRNTQFHRIVATDPGRALREGVHNGVRESIERTLGAGAVA